MAYLLDTNTVSFIIKGRARVLEHLISIPMDQITLSTVTEAELRYGLSRRPEATRLKIGVEEFLLRVEILPWDSNAARSYAELRAALERTGRSMGNLDMMIAAHALATRAMLVSSDRAFRKIKGLVVEDWTAA